MGCNLSQTPLAKQRQHEHGDTPTSDQNSEYEALVRFLVEVPLFQRLPKDQHPILAGACVPHSFMPGQNIINQGDIGREFFVIRSGVAQVLVKKGDEPEKEVAKLQAGDYFGEVALLRNEHRTATIRAVEALSALKISREVFQEHGLHERLCFETRKAVVGDHADQQPAQARSLPRLMARKTQADRAFIMDSISQNPTLKVLALTDARKRQMADKCWRENVPAGKAIIRQGSVEADFFYIVREGSFEVSVNKDFRHSSAEEAVRRVAEKPNPRIRRGGSFGELALLYVVPRAATVTAMEDSVVWVIDRHNFKKIIMQVSSERVEEYVKYLDRVNLLSPLIREEKRALARAMVQVNYAKNDVILRQGEAGSSFYVLYEGEVSVVKDGIEQVRYAADMEKGTAHYFGERALLNNEPRAATVHVVSRWARVLVLEKALFDMLLGPLEEMFKYRSNAMCAPCLPCGAFFHLAKMKSRARSRMDVALIPPAPEADEEPREHILMQDLIKLGHLGSGGFGTVDLFQHKATQCTYAMKALHKGHIVKTGMTQCVMKEKMILMTTNSPFIIRLHETYNKAAMLYFLMEPALGGELYATYKRKGFHGSEQHARFYTGSVVLAFEHLHERRIIYRDLKPENLILTDKGYLKVTDMGLSKFVVGPTYTTCGTPDYFAPEIISSTGHTQAVDWWTLGVLIFELLTGSPPFESDSPMETYSKVMKGIEKVAFPALFGKDGEELVRALLRHEPSLRVPMRPGGTRNLKAQAWYEEFDWKALSELTMEPPYVPTVKSNEDLRNFKDHGPSAMGQLQALEYRDDGSGWDADFATA